jgi:predicted permease
MSVVFNTVVPVFSIIALGYFLAARRELHLPTLSDLAILVTSPALMFSVLSGAELEVNRWGILAGGTIFVAASTALLALAYLRTGGEGRRGLLLPAIFWNAGNMTLPCARLAFGLEGLEAAAIVFVTMAMLTSTFGIWIAKGENGLGEALRLPLLYASVGGMALAVSDQTLPRVVMEPIEMLGAMAIPILLLNLGIQLRTLRVTDVKHSVAVVAIRMGGGVVFAWLFVTAFGIHGLERQILLLASAMPPAVINAVFAQRYGRDPTLVASCIVLGTLVSLLVIPAVLYFAT